MPTLSERIREAIETSGVSVNDIAQACGISVQSVYQWMRGDTKMLDGDNLVELAAITGFEPRWIAKEKGPKLRRYAQNSEQEHVLKIMQELPPNYAGMVVKIVDTVAEQSPNGDGKTKAA